MGWIALIVLIVGAGVLGAKFSSVDRFYVGAIKVLSVVVVALFAAMAVGMWRGW